MLPSDISFVLIRVHLCLIPLLSERSFFLCEVLNRCRADAKRKREGIEMLDHAAGCKDCDSKGTPRSVTYGSVLARSPAFRARIIMLYQSASRHFS